MLEISAFVNTFVNQGFCFGFFYVCISCTRKVPDILVETVYNLLAW